MTQNTCLLLVEGPDDNGVMYHLLTRHGIQFSSKDRAETGKITLKTVEGIENVKKHLVIRLKLQDEDREFQTIAVIVDTDTPTVWDAFQDIFVRSGYTTIPEAPHPEGTIIVESGLATIGIWLMPDNQHTGSLEHFIQSLIPFNDNLWDRAERVIAEIPVEERRFHNKQKAQVHTWLAWQELPGVPMGLAITKHYFDAHAPFALQLVSWIRRLFVA